MVVVIASEPDAGCPDAERLALYTLGLVAPDEEVALSDHVLGCARCVATLDSLPAQSDTLADRIRRLALPPEPVVPLLALGSETLGLLTETPTPSQVPLRAQWLGRYELLEELGRGGMGVVYKAKQRPLDRIVAVKTVAGGQLATSQALARFRTEAEAVSQLRHENVVQLYEYSDADGEACFSMEYVRGMTLAAMIGCGQIEPADAVHVVLQVAAAVQHANDRGVLHRDLKPSNVLIDETGTAKLNDFGLAKFLDADMQRTGSLEIMGTAGYLAPEQLRGSDAKLGPTTDVFGLGAVLYACLTRQAPHQGSDHYQTLLAAAKGEIRPIRDLNPAVPPELDAVCMNCLAPAQADRYQSADEFAADLRRWQSGHKPRAKPAKPRTPRTPRPVRFTRLFGGVAVLGLVMAAMGQSRVGSDAARDEVQSQVNAGNPVTLIGASGAPAWLRTDGKVKTGLDEEGYFRCETWERAFVELVPDSGREAYRVSAEVQMLDAREKSSVGIIGGFHPPEKGKDVYSFFCTTYSDLVGPIRDDQLTLIRIRRPNFMVTGGRVRVEGALFARKMPVDWFREEDAGRFVVPLCQQGQTPWRSLSLDIHATFFRGRFDEPIFQENELQRSLGELCSSLGIAAKEIR